MKSIQTLSAAVLICAMTLCDFLQDSWSILPNLAHAWPW